MLDLDPDTRGAYCAQARSRRWDGQLAPSGICYPISSRREGTTFSSKSALSDAPGLLFVNASTNSETELALFQSTKPGNRFGKAVVEGPICRD